MARGGITATAEGSGLGDVDSDDLAHARRTGRETTLVLEIGSVINHRYRLDQIIGGGGMGVVYLAHDVLEDRPVAIKTLRTRDASPAALSQFKAEFRTMTRLNHPHLARAYDYEPIEGLDHALIAMEYIAGEDLLKATVGRSWRDIVGFLVQLCRALAYLHSRQLIHFDLKPSNVLLSGETIKILDFGIAGVRPERQIEQIRGTPHYMAPEIGRIGAPIDHRVDLYSLGIMAFQLLTRRLPFSDGSPAELMRAHRTEPVRFPGELAPEVPQGVRDIVVRLCAKQPSARFRTANALIEAINGATGLSFELETRETRESYVFSTELVGRDRELMTAVSFVKGRLDGMQPSDARQSPLLLVGGQSGVGKSRLMREVRHHLQISRVQFLDSDCFEDKLAEYGPIAHSLRSIVRLCEAAGGGTLIDRFGPDLARIDPSIARGRELPAPTVLGNAAADRLRLLDSLSEFLVCVAELTPFVLYVNDLQWAQQGTADALEHIVRYVRVREDAGDNVRLALIGSYRDDEVEARPIGTLLGRMREDGLTPALLTLQPLQAADVRRLVTSMLGVGELPADFLVRIVDESGGNAYFVEALMRAGVESGGIYLDRGRWEVSHTWANFEARTIEEVFLRRAGSLPVTLRIVLDALAVCARPAPCELVALACELSFDDALESLHALERKGLVLLTPGVEPLYRISHDRLRDALINAIAETRRIDLHRMLADTLEKKADAELADLVAFHYARAGAWQEALVHEERAALAARRNAHANEAARHYENLVLWTEKLGASERVVDFLFELQRLYETLGEREREEKCLARLVVLATGRADSGLLGDALVRQGEFLGRVGRRDDALRALNRALALFRAQGDVARECRVLRGLAFVAWQNGQSAEALEHQRGILAMSRGLGDTTAYVNDVIGLATSLRQLDRKGEALELLRDAEPQLDELPPQGQAALLLAISSAHIERGELERAMHVRKRLREVLRGKDTPLYEIIVEHAIASLHARMGDSAASIAAYEQAIALARRRSYGSELAGALRSLASVLMSVGRFAEAGPYLNEATGVCALLGDRTAQLETWELLGALHETTASHASGARAWTRARSLAHAIGDTRRELDALLRLARALRAEGDDWHEPLGLYEEARVLAARLGDRASEARVLNHIGIVRWQLRDFEAALGCYRRALELFRAEDDFANAGLALNSIALTLRSLGRVDEAEHALRRALEHHAEHHEPMLEGHASLILGEILLLQGRADESIVTLRGSLSIRRRLGDARGEGWVQLALSRAYAASGSQAESRACLESAVSLAQSLGDTELERECHEAGRS